MGTVVKPFTYVNGTVIDATELNSNFDTLYTLVNGSLDTANLATNSVGTSEIVNDAVNDLKIDWGTGTNQVSLDNVPNGGTYKQYNPASVAITGGSISGITDLPVADGGTGASTASGARTNLQINSQLGWFNNLAIARATTTNAGDSIKITSADGTALSASNVGILRLPATTAGQITEFTVTADVTILLTGAHWGAGTNGDLTGALLRVLAINDNGTLKWGVAYLGGRQTLLIGDTTPTRTDIILPEHVLCAGSGVGSSTNRCREIGYVRADFDDTGGAAEDLWAVQTGIGDVVTGEIADGIWQPWNPPLGGWSVLPTVAGAWWCQVGRKIHIALSTTGGTSDSAGTQFSGPAKAQRPFDPVPIGIASVVDNGSRQTAAGLILAGVVDSRTLDVRRDFASTNFTASGTKNFYGSATYIVGPAASFID